MQSLGQSIPDGALTIEAASSPTFCTDNANGPSALNAAGQTDANPGPPEPHSPTELVNEGHRSISPGGTRIKVNPGLVQHKTEPLIQAHLNKES